ncbi:GrlR family regulatory protein [Desulfogranum japonicum]|uniref:GrlR family regulatory protein n=1 Tax=Desulfogranum japonicum TaxID=231447 RepID=UPI0004145D9C
MEGKIEGNGEGYTIRGQISPVKKACINGVLTITQGTANGYAPLGKFKEATFYMEGELDQELGTFTLQGHAYGHHVIHLTCKGEYEFTKNWAG